MGLGLRLVLHLLFDHPGYRAPDVVQVGFQNLFQVVEDIIHDPVEEGFEGGAGWATGHGNYSTLEKWFASCSGCKCTACGVRR